MISDAWAVSALLAFIALLALGLASTHILQSKGDVRSAIAWLGVVWLVPFFGVLFYLLFGISRIRRRARQARVKRGLPQRSHALEDPGGKKLGSYLPDIRNRWQSHSLLAGRVSGQPLTAANDITPLNGGRDAYDAMITAINNAKHTIALTTFIFQADQAGRRFLSALTRAHERGVEVRVLVDAVGNLYGLKPVARLLRRRGVPVALFNPARLSWRIAFFNLRTHRKILVVDGRTGFAGGMNIRKHHLEEKSGVPRVRDTHFCLKGPIVGQLMDAFADDWAFATEEELSGKMWFPARFSAAGSVVARAVPDGPDESRPKTQLMLESALAVARRQVRIITPYFIPGTGLVSALERAALRGVDVTIVIPEKNNLPFFNLSAFAGLKPLLAAGCEILLAKPPFDHTKLVIIDDVWVMFGSSNWDERSLKLNFEFNVECYDEKLAQKMIDWTQEPVATARRLDRDYLQGRPVIKRIFGRLLWLLSPYL